MLRKWRFWFGLVYFLLFSWMTVLAITKDVVFERGWTMAIMISVALSGLIFMIDAWVTSRRSNS